MIFLSEDADFTICLIGGDGDIWEPHTEIVMPCEVQLPHTWFSLKTARSRESGVPDSCAKSLLGREGLDMQRKRE